MPISLLRAAEGLFVTRCRVPRDLESVTAIDRGSEVHPREVGADPVAIERIWQAVLRLYASGIQPAIQICVRRRGAVLLNRAIGHARGNGPNDPVEMPKVLATPDTPFTIFSASKAITAMLVHLVDERNLLRLDDPVCEYMPEFGTRGKEQITIRHVLTHRAAIQNLPRDAVRLEFLAHPERILQLLCNLEPQWKPGQWLGYHAISGGFILAEVIRRVTGKPIEQFLDEEVRRPLGFRYFAYGVPAPEIGAVARNYFTGPPPLPPFSTVLERALGTDFRSAADLSNDPRFLLGIIPSANLVTTARELSAFFQLLLQGGELDGVRIFEPRTVRRATLEEAYIGLDLTLLMPLRYGLGFMLGGRHASPFGPDTEHAYGHLGFTNIACWADPEREVAAALLTSGKPLVYPELYYAWGIARQIGLACPKTGRTRRRGTVPLRRMERRAARQTRSARGLRRLRAR